MKLPSSAVNSSETLQDRIRLARLSAKLSQARLAKAADVTPSAAAQWEHPSGTHPTIASLQSIASATNVSIEWLVSGVGQRAPKRQTVSADEITAVNLETFAQNVAEESLLQKFRAMPSKSRNLLLMIAAALSPKRTHKRKRL